jgi:hypothetical protein
MIDENDNYRCDYCAQADENGMYYTETGNHVLCQDRATLDARIAELEVEREKLLDLLQWIFDDGHGGEYRSQINLVLVKAKQNELADLMAKEPQP